MLRAGQHKGAQARRDSEEVFGYGSVADHPFLVERTLPECDLM